jgi:GGDEF domain-containing protein
LIQSDEIQIEFSIGISLYPQHGTRSEILMDLANAALYQAKGTGRRWFAYFLKS